MFLIDAIKANVERNENLLDFLHDCLGVGSWEHTKYNRFVSFYVRFAGGNKKFLISINTKSLFVLNYLMHSDFCPFNIFFMKLMSLF